MLYNEKFWRISTSIFSHRSNSRSTEIFQQNTLFNMQIVNKKGEEVSLCQASHLRCFRTKNFDRFHQGMSRWHVIQIPQQNSEFQLYSDMWKYSALVLFGQRRKMFNERRVMEKHLLGGKDTLIFFSNMLNTSSLKEIQHKLASCYPCT